VNITDDVVAKMLTREQQICKIRCLIFSETWTNLCKYQRFYLGADQRYQKTSSVAFAGQHQNRSRS